MRKYFFPYLLMALFAIGFAASDEIEIVGPGGTEGPSGGGDNNPDTEVGLVQLDGTIDLEESVLATIENCQVSTFSDEADIKDGKFKVETEQNNSVQTFFVEDEEGKVYMIAREPAKKGQTLDISIESTALSFVTLHPIFSALDKSVYEEMNKFIVESSLYEPYKAEIAKLVVNHKDLFSENNTELLVAYNNLLEDLFKDVDETAFSRKFSINHTNLATRSVYDNPNLYPLSADISGNKLTVRNTNLTPSYYGSVTTSDGQERPFNVLSGNDWGWWEWLTQGQTRYGQESVFTFTSEGEYRFNLSRTNELATFDFYMRMTLLTMSCFGFETSEYANTYIQATQTIANTLSATLGNLADGDYSTMEVLGTVTSTICDVLENTTLDDKKNISNIRKFSNTLGRALRIYNLVKGISNIIDRIAYAIDAPKEIQFCLCYYNGEISTCTQTTIVKIENSDKQEGYPNQKLMLPLKVYVQTLGDDGLYYPSSSYHKVKFEVISGGGYVDEELVGTNESDRTASTYWTLGASGTQEVKVTAIDIITGKEVSEPVYFTATLKENADLTVRLDWNKLSGNTDIDLHVTDPFGEEIAYYHMNSASGGWLDRDDVVGPGPEHISWTSAPQGSYLVQVHYYHSETQAVTSYKVTINALGKTYGPYTGSIAYHQLVTIGVLDIPSGTFTRTTSTEDSVPVFLEKKEVKDNIIYPFKK